MMEYSLEDDIPEEFKKSTLAIHSSDTKSINVNENEGVAVLENNSNSTSADNTSNSNRVQDKLITAIPQCSK